MSSKQMADKPESVRLLRDEAQWLDKWCATSAQDRSTVIRAAVRAFVAVVQEMDFDDGVRFIARLSGADPKGTDDTAAEVRAAIAKLVASQTRKH